MTALELKPTHKPVPNYYPALRQFDDLGGNVRKNPKLSGTTHNVFGIPVGVGINIFVRKRKATAKA